MEQQRNSDIYCEEDTVILSQAETSRQLQGTTEDETFDLSEYGKYKRFTGIRLWSGSVVDAVQFLYDNEVPDTKLGGNGGGMRALIFQPDEYVVEVRKVIGLWAPYYDKRVIAELTFCTNQGRVLSGGSAASCKQNRVAVYQAQPGECFHAFAVQYDDKYVLDLPHAYSRAMGLQRFNDTGFAQDKERITKILLRSGWVVDGVQVFYDGVPAPFRGSQSGGEQSLVLDKDEYLVAIEGKIGKYEFSGAEETLCSVTFRTSKGRTLSGGTADRCSNLKDFSRKAAQGEQIFALAGSHQGYLCNLIIGMYALKDETPDMGEKAADWPDGRMVQAKGAPLTGDSLTGAVAGGCFSSNELEKMTEQLLSEELNEACRNEIKARQDDIVSSYVTRKYVSTPQYVFRGPTIPGEQDHIMKNKKLLSKYQCRGGSGQPVITAAEENRAQAEYSTVLRILATKSSNEPPSQFVSHALDYATAASFVQGKKCVFAYQIIPNSPLLAMAGERTVGKREDQFQILGGTEVISLYKYDPFDGKRWYRYDFTTQKWVRTKKRPVNGEYQRLQKEEL